jgi:acetyl-CoA acetyltransferase
MRFENVYIPYGAYWSTPFSRWQGSFATLHPIEFAAETTTRALSQRNIAPEAFDGVHLGTTVPSKHSFYGAPWLAGLIGAEGVTGPTVGQACATSARVIGGAAAEVDVAGGDGRAILAVTADRTSNGPHLVYPNPGGPGGTSDAEDWVWDNFSCDPFANNSMTQTAENVAQESGITTEEQHEVVLLRHKQYQDALADDGAFLRR